MESSYPPPPLVIWPTRAVKSNWFRFDSIFDWQGTKTFRFDSISIWFKNDSIRYKNRLSRHKKKLPIWKLTNFIKGSYTRMEKNILRIVFVMMFSEFFILYYHNSGFFLFTFLPRSNRIESYRKSRISFDSICIRFDLIWAKTFDSITKYDSISIRFDSPVAHKREKISILKLFSLRFMICITLAVSSSDTSKERALWILGLWMPRWIIHPFRFLLLSSAFLCVHSPWPGTFTVSACQSRSKSVFQ